jgi:histone-lysine N-methyltransferase SETD2
MASPGDLKVKTRWRKTAEMQDLTINPENENHSDSQFMPSDQLDERLSKFATIPENIYLSERVVCKINKTMKCDCTLSEEEIRAGQLGCRSNCINRLLYIECSPKCRLGVYCDNQQFQKKQYAECDVFRTEKKGFGILAKQEIYPDQFIIEYVGEVLNNNQFDKRAKLYSQEQNKHYYFMALRSNAIIDATIKGNISRFINHSCDPNAMTQKWTVNGELRVGFFSTRFIKPGEEITFDYQFQRYGKKAQKCYCEAENCRGWIGEQPVSDEEEDECESEEGESEEGDDEREEEIPEQEKTPESQKLDKPEKKKKARAGRKKKVVLSKPIVESQDQSSDDEADIDDSKEVEPSQEDIKMPIKKRESTRKYAKKLKKRQEMFDDLEIEEEIKELLRTGLKNRAHTVTFSRLVVRAKNLEARFQLLEILITGDLACQRLFLDYNGLKLFYNYWMSDINKNSVHELKFCIKLLEVLEILPIKNKTVLRDSKVLMMVEKWQNIDLEEKKKKSKEEKKQEKLKKKMKAANPDASMESNPEALPDANLELQDLVKTDVPDEVTCLKMALKEMADQILKKWEVLVEDFKIPKKQKLEEMKLHEKEADLHYQATERDSDRKDDRFKSRNKDAKVTESKSFYRKVPPIVPPNDPLSKHQRRQMFEIQMAQKDAEKRVLEMWAIHEQNCAIFGLNPQMVAPSDIPVYMNSVTGQYYTLDNRPLPTPPNHPRFNISIPPLPQSPEHYDMPKIDLPEHWKYAIDEKGRIYYYHVKIREPQWEPPIKLAPLSKDEDDDGRS